MSENKHATANKTSKVYSNTQTGFTLVELIMVIIITGIISGMVAIFLKTPVDQYMDIARRAEMTDIADTALRRMGRDIRTAVPNSVRLSGNYLEFLPTKTGGRYRANDMGGLGSCAGAGDALSFSSADSCFEIIGSPIDFVAGDQIVIGSTQSNGNPPYQDPTDAAVCSNLDTSTCIRRPVPVGGVGVQKVVMTSLYAFPHFAEFPTQRFQVISASEQAVTYACENVGGTTDGTGTLKRYWHYGFNPTQTAPVGGSSALLADKISACSIDYGNSNPRNALVAISLTIMQGGESISLYHEIHVDNVP